MIPFTYAMIALAGVIPIVLYRFVRGPSIPDRVVALEALVSIVMALLVLNSYIQGSSVYIDAALVLSIFGFISTVAIAKYLVRGDLFA
ncbi:MAG: monovalent cation/H+ antiporter complex subunit F [Candidatus Thermoplasmatota archaeon]|nr:monovalent cation/H+ antiporter complex subunit F [Candidatus Thermoplasmatota archaeon]